MIVTEQYISRYKKLVIMRRVNKSLQDQEDALNDELDVLWHKMTPDEIKLVEAECAGL